jgi:divinyl protochlorophyllide a 8-vinyl-reductase
VDSHVGSARIGPNAITQLAAALEARLGPARTAGVFEAAGLGRYRAAPPAAMVPESEVTDLHRALRAALDPDEREAVCRDAGERTADYLLAHRIPRPVQRILRLLPARLASRALLAAISRHSWTFAGSGRFGVEPGNPLLLSIRGCALCRGASVDAPDCAYYAATFERLYRVLVSPRARAREVDCEARGATACRFEIRW